MLGSTTSTPLTSASACLVKWLMDVRCGHIERQPPGLDYVDHPLCTDARLRSEPFGRDTKSLHHAL